MIQGNIDRKFMDLYLSELLFWWCTVACHIKNKNKKEASNLLNILVAFT